jgi:hypothetical protein
MINIILIILIIIINIIGISINSIILILMILIYMIFRNKFFTKFINIISLNHFKIDILTCISHKLLDKKIFLKKILFNILFKMI